MTDKRWYAPFRLNRFAAAIALIVCSCAHAEGPVVAAMAEPASPALSIAAPPEDINAVLSSSQVMDGSILVVTIAKKEGSSADLSTLKGDFEGMELPFYPSDETAASFQAVLGVPYDHKVGAAKIHVRLGLHEFDLPFTVLKGDYASESIKVDGRRVNPQRPKDLARIKKEQAEIGKIYGTVTPIKYWNGPFKFPIDSPITSRYGTKRVYNGVQKSFHPGLDLKAPVGTPIRADAAGEVVLAKDLFFTGGTVFIDHGYGVITLYAHMSKIQVKKGQKVKAGELLGLSGKTGRVTGPHLHWQCVIHRQKVNPLDLTQVMR